MSHLTREQRYTISQMKQNGEGPTAIAEMIGKNKSVVSRELLRNCDKRSGIYNYDLAQRKYEKRQAEKPKHKRFTSQIQEYVEIKLADKYSPEQIVGEAKNDGVACVSTERIYQHVWEDKGKGGKLYKNLRTQGKRYRKRGCSKDKRGIIKNKVSIEERPKEVDLKERVGDLEIDTIIGLNHKGAILSINDRVTGCLKLKKLNGKDAKELAQAAIDTLQDWKPFIKTITADNGKEFAEHQAIAQQLGISFFFAHPYHSWERGANENLNGLVRQYIPKKTDFSTITEEYVKWVEDKINNRPRKRFNFKTPNQILNLKCVAFIT
jgi:transposase, IS30 family